MNREIKFRAWHIPTKRLFEVYSLCPDVVFENSMDGVHTSPTLPAERKDCILMQFTGLKDKNGVDIYEGDIVEIFLSNKSFGHKYKVIFEDCQYVLYHTRLSNNNGGFLKWGALANIEERNLDIEVIGNIYENPELL